MNNGTFESFASTTHPGTSEPPTIESLQQIVDTLKAQGYLQDEIERQNTAIKGFIVLTSAYRRGVLTEKEYIHLSGAIASNGGLIISPFMYKQLTETRS